MSQQNCVTDSQSMLQSMLQGLQIMSSAEMPGGLRTQAQQHTSDNAGVGGPVQKLFQAPGPRDKSLQGPTDIPRWRRTQAFPGPTVLGSVSTLPNRYMNRVVTSKGGGTNESLCTHQAGQQISDGRYVPPWETGRLKRLHGDSIAMSDGIQRGERGGLRVPLYVPHLTGSGTPVVKPEGGSEQSDHFSTWNMREGPPSQTSILLKQAHTNPCSFTGAFEGMTTDLVKLPPREAGANTSLQDEGAIESPSNHDPAFSLEPAIPIEPNSLEQNFGLSAKIPKRRKKVTVPQRYQAHQDVWDFNFWNASKVTEEVTEMEHHFPSLSAGGNVPLQKNKWWKEEKTKTWAQRIREKWRESKVTLKKREKAHKDNMGREEDKGGARKTDAQLKLIQQQIKEEVVGENPTWEEETVRQAQLCKATPTHQSPDGDSKGSHVSDIQFSLSPINLENFTGEEWTNFLPKYKANPTPLEATKLSVKDIWSQKNLDLDNVKMAGIQAGQSEKRVCIDTQLDFRGGQYSYNVRNCTLQSEDANHDARYHDFTKLNRKRVHGAWEWRDRREPAEGLGVSQGFRDPTVPFIPESHTPSSSSPESEGFLSDAEMDVRATNPSIMPPHPLRYPPSSLSKPSESQDAASFFAAKKRKIAEETRHVRFAEVLVTVAPPSDLPLEVVMEDSGPSTETSLPDWIVALKKKTKRKPRR